MTGSVCDLKHNEIHKDSVSDTFMFCAEDWILEIFAARMSFSSIVCSPVCDLMNLTYLFACKYTFLSDTRREFLFTWSEEELRCCSRSEAFCSSGFCRYRHSFSSCLQRHDYVLWSWQFVMNVIEIAITKWQQLQCFDKGTMCPSMSIEMKNCGTAEILKTWEQRAGLI